MPYGEQLCAMLAVPAVLSRIVVVCRPRLGPHAGGRVNAIESHVRQPVNAGELEVAVGLALVPALVVQVGP